jgi:hypothetical protein
VRRGIAALVLASMWLALVLFVTAASGGWFATTEHSCPPIGSCPSPATKAFHWHHALAGGVITAVLAAGLFVPLCLAVKDKQHRLARREALQGL